MEELQALRRRRDRELENLASLSSRKQKHHRIRRLLRGSQLKPLYAFNALNKVGELGKASKQDVLELASRFNPFGQTDEPVNVKFIRKNGAPRQVTAFGKLKRMHQDFVADILRKIHPPRENQYMFSGGMPAAFRAVEAAKAEGYAFGMEIDVIGFYGSVTSQGLVELLRPIPASVTANVIWDNSIRRGDQIHIGVTNDTSIDAQSFADTSVSASLSGLMGMAPGSVTSPIVAERIIGSILNDFANCKIITYADNIFVAGMTECEVVTCVQNLCQRALDVEMGPLRFSTGSMQSLHEEVRFLHQIGQNLSGGWQWRPDENKQAQYLIAHDDHAQLEDIDDAARRISNWRRAYPDWHEGDRFEIERKAELATAKYFRKGSPANRSDAVDKLLVSCLVTRPSRSIDELMPGVGTAKEVQRKEELIGLVHQRMGMITRE